MMIFVTIDPTCHKWWRMMTVVAIDFRSSKAMENDDCDVVAIVVKIFVSVHKVKKQSKVFFCIENFYL